MEAQKSKPKQGSKAKQKKQIQNEDEEEEQQNGGTQLVSESQSDDGVQKKAQLEAQRRKLRRKYRTLIKEVEDKKQELIQPDSQGLELTMDKSDELLTKVQTPREGKLDSELFSHVSEYGAEQTRRLHTGLKSRDIGDLTTKIKLYLLTRDFQQMAQNEANGQNNNDIHDELNRSINNNANDEPEEEQLMAIKWDDFGKTILKYFARTPSITFMYGPLSILPPEKKERKKREKDKIEKKSAPEEVQGTQTNEEVDKDTRKRVEGVRSVLHSAAKDHSVNFFQFITDPASFSQTVENLFYLSFLVKEGHAGVQVEKQPYGRPLLCINSVSDGTEVPVTLPAAPPSPEDYTNGKAERHQCVVRLDYAMWKAAKEKFRINDNIIPHRKSGQYNYPQKRSNSNNEHSMQSSLSQSQGETQQTRKARQTTLSSQTNKKSNSQHDSEEEQPLKARRTTKAKRVADSDEEQAHSKTNGTAKGSSNKKRKAASSEEQQESEEEQQLVRKKKK